ncbi:MAG: ceramidase domain-containing protein [Pseudomonadota bacterium]
MGLDTKLFNYCERGLDPTFWAEPTNAITNAAFLVAAGFAAASWRAQPAGTRRFATGFFILVLTAIGIGSFLFHTYATVWAVIADVAPIGVFMISYFAYALRVHLRLPWIVVAAGTIGFIVLLQGAGDISCGGRPCFNGSLGYAPALAAMLVIGPLMLVWKRPGGTLVLGAGLVFALSLTLRTLDYTLCEAVQAHGHRIGTHFAWHILNALTLYLLIKAALIAEAAHAASSSSLAAHRAPR